MTLKSLFWLFLGIILYTYVGYTILLVILAGIKRIMTGKREDYNTMDHTPPVTLLIPAYNEEQFVLQKVQNTLELDYPRDKLKVIWITDGSNDKTHELLSQFSGIVQLHDHERRGKIHAMNHGMKKVQTPLVIFTDANTMLNREAIREIVNKFNDLETGCVTGEKRINLSGKQKAVDAGEGLYWQYESLIKRLESETGSVVGAVGEILAIRTNLYEEVKEDTLLDDFTLSLQIIRKKHTIKYAPHAWGTETASLSINEEIKRKIRIATGGWQSLTRMPGFLNPFKYGLFSFKYFSHKVLRWTLVPFSFPIVLLLNLAILFTPENNSVFVLLFGVQIFFYLFAIAGRLMDNRRTGFSVFFAPYYLFIMNYAVIKGFFRFLSGNYSVRWQKVKRT